MIVTPHSWVWTQSETAAELRSSERITAVEIFKSCGSACSHTSFSTAPASSFQRQSYTTDSSTHPTHPDRQSGRSVKTRARHKTLSSSQTHTPRLELPFGKTKSGSEGASPGAWRPSPRSRLTRIWHSFALPIRGPWPATVRLEQPALGCPLTPGNAEPKEQNCPTPLLRRGSF